jgi:phosphatidate phosphatase APP1
MPNDFLKGMKDKAKDLAKGAADKADGLIDRAEGAARDIVGKVARAFERDKEVVVYPTYAYRKAGDEGTWVVRLRVWVNKARRAPVPSSFLAPFTSELGHLTEEQLDRLRERISAFVADDDSKETVAVSFDQDPEGRTYVLPRATDDNGLVTHELEIPDASAQAIRAAQGAVDGWLDFTVTAADDYEGKGRARLVEPEGVSVISDIDDTIKITEVPAGKRILLRNTFLRDYAPVEEMKGLYRAYGEDVMFHYVSGSPWQLHKLLGEFVGSNFPEGAFHMKDVRKNLRSPESWHDFVAFSQGDEATLIQKKEQIGRILRAFPRRRFILYGDSGEKDPEVFREMKLLFGEQVSEIHIRDVVGESLKPAPNRLDRQDGIKMEVVNRATLEADTVRHGVSRFGD